MGLPDEKGHASWDPSLRAANAGVMASSKGSPSETPAARSKVRLATHGGKLFAGVGYFGQDPREPHAPGAQILRKDSVNGGWQVDATFPDYVRVDTLVAVTFTSDVAGLWWKKAKPWGVNEDEPTSVAVRGNVWYLAGHGAERKLLNNTAWIDKGTLNSQQQ